jgi:hypothetical protein
MTLRQARGRWTSLALAAGALVAFACAGGPRGARSTPPERPTPLGPAGPVDAALPPPLDAGTADDGGSFAVPAGEIVEPLTDVELVSIDTLRWAGDQCHPSAVWTDDRGCVPQPGAPAVRCGSERVERRICDCAPGDLMCAMRCDGKRRTRSRWLVPAPTREQADCRLQCKKGHAPSCLHLARALLDGKTDPAEGMDLLEKGCRLGYEAACNDLFLLYESEPAARSRDIAARVEESDCARSTSDEEACTRAARAYEQGWGVPASAETAKRYRRRACAMVAARCRKAAEGSSTAAPACPDYFHACAPRD